jgi:hypothetical protein
MSLTTSAQTKNISLAGLNPISARGKKYPLKGPMHEIFEHGVFTQIRPVRVGSLGTRRKNAKTLWLEPYVFIFIADFFNEVG